jgi:hypothetical protein
MRLLKSHRESLKNTDDSGEHSGAAVTGLAAAFEPAEVKKLFFRYLITILSVEGVIFFLCYINLLVTDSHSFPWKPYLFGSFIAPIATTFIFGLILLIFNRFFFNQLPPSVESLRSVPLDFGTGKGDRIAFFLQVVHRLPILLSMVLLIAATALAYNLDVIVVYMAQVGASTARYLFFTLIGLLVVVAVGIAVWMLLSYRLRQRSLQTGHQYRMQLMEQFGMVLLEDGTMINREGEVVYQQNGVEPISYSEATENVQMIEEISDEGGTTSPH